MHSVAVIGAGLAGSEAALALARCGIAVELFEMRPGRMTPAHRTGLPAELICSNSLKSENALTAHGVLKDELRVLESPLVAAAQRTRVPAGSALAVDRAAFSEAVLADLRSQPHVRIVRAECTQPPLGHDICLIAAGPLASEGLTQWMARSFSGETLYFYDAIAPIVDADSVDRSIAFEAARGDPESADYLNCPFTEGEYRRFHEALTAADKVVAHEFEQARFFEACLPVEVIAERGYLALAFGTLKPIGLIDPRTGRRPFAVCQLRKENIAGQSYGLVGFQTRLRIPDQQRVFRLIPGLERAEFLHYGSIHRNTYLDSPRLLTGDLSFRARPDLFLAGQISGGEGYTESIATGHVAALAVAARLNGRAFTPPPTTTTIGALLAHITGSERRPFTPSNVNFGLLAPLIGVDTKRGGKRAKKEHLRRRAIEDITIWRREFAPSQPFGSRSPDTSA